jgi:hypothetical protein
VQPTAPGWYLDPFGRPQLWRWFTGRVYTDFVSADPRVPSPTPPPSLDPDEQGRVHGGGLTFPVLPEPWRPAPPYLDASDEVGQELVVAPSGRGPYVACIFLADLPAKFEYAGPTDLERAGSSCADELLVTYYPHEHPTVRETYTDPIDGRPAWRNEVRLDIDDEHLPFAREDALIIVVDRGDGTAGLLYASLPVIDPVPSVAEVLAQLQLV